jgi:hypothetical protein
MMFFRRPRADAVRNPDEPIVRKSDGAAIGREEGRRPEDGRIRPLRTRTAGRHPARINALSPVAVRRRPCADRDGSRQGAAHGPDHGRNGFGRARRFRRGAAGEHQFERVSSSRKSTHRLRRVVNGLTGQEIGRKCGSPPRAVEVRRAWLMRKPGAGDVAGLVAKMIVNR